MGDSAAVTPGDRHAGRIVDLLNELRDRGWHLGVGHYVSARHVLESLGNVSRDTLRDSIGPLVCSSAEEQRAFDDIFARWYEPVAESEGEQETFEPTPRPQRSMLLLASLAFVAAVGLLALAYFSRPAPPPVIIVPEGGRVNQSTPSDVDWGMLQIILAAGGLVLLTGVLIYRHKRRLSLRRAFGSPSEFEERILRVSNSRKESEEQRALSKRLHVRKVSDVLEVDVDRTIEASIQNGGWLKPVLRPLRFTPEYLILVDRASRNDHLASYYDTIVQSFSAAQVPIATYEFQRDPRLVWLKPRKRPAAGSRSADLPRRPVSVTELARKHSAARLLVLSDTAGFVDPLSGMPRRWLDSFTPWRDKFILAPPDVTAAERRVRALRERGFGVVSADSAGLLTLKSIFTSDHPRSSAAVRPRPLPPLLAAERSRLLDRRPPSAELQEQLSAELQGFLGDQGFDWLCACAVYPSINWPLTLYLGSILGIEDESRSIVSSLARLPWFRQGMIPDWLRAALVVRLRPESRARVHTALTTLFNDALTGVPGNFALPIATRPSPIARLRRWAMLSDLSAAQPAGSAVRDYVLLAFMGDRLSVPVPRGIRELLSPRAAKPPKPRVEPEPLTEIRYAGSERVVFLVLSYLGLLALVARISGKRSREVRWHSSQGLALLTAWLAVTVGAYAIPVVSCFGSLISFVISLYVLIGDLVGLIVAIQGRRLRIWPVGWLADVYDRIGMPLVYAAEPTPEPAVLARTKHITVWRGAALFFSYVPVLSLAVRILSRRDEELRWHASHGTVLSLSWLLFAVLPAVDADFRLTMLRVLFSYLAAATPFAAFVLALAGIRLRIWRIGALVDRIASINTGELTRAAESGLVTPFTKLIGAGSLLLVMDRIVVFPSGNPLPFPPGIAAALLIVVGGILSDRFLGAARAFRLGLAAVAAGYLLAASSVQPWGVIGMTLVLIGRGLALPAFFELLSRVEWKTTMGASSGAGAMVFVLVSPFGRALDVGATGLVIAGLACIAATILSIGLIEDAPSRAGIPEPRVGLLVLAGSVLWVAFATMQSMTGVSPSALGGTLELAFAVVVAIAFKARHDISLGAGLLGAFIAAAIYGSTLMDIFEGPEHEWGTSLLVFVVTMARLAIEGGIIAAIVLRAPRLFAATLIGAYLVIPGVALFDVVTVESMLLTALIATIAVWAARTTDSRIKSGAT